MDRGAGRPAHPVARRRGRPAGAARLRQGRLRRVRRQAKRHELGEELRLGYVAFTRPRHRLVVSSYVWTTPRKSPCGPSEYQELARDFLVELGEPVPEWPEPAREGRAQPDAGTAVEVEWPVDQHTPEVLRRLELAELVRAEMVALAEGPVRRRSSRCRPSSRTSSRGGTPRRSACSPRRRAAPPSRRGREAVEHLGDGPGRSATDPEGFAESLARPMPRQPSPAARFGTRFHAWVEEHFARNRQDLLVDPDELADRADAGHRGRRRPARS